MKWTQVGLFSGGIGAEKNPAQNVYRLAGNHETERNRRVLNPIFSTDLFIASEYDFN